ncbi:hypothetical protein RY831_19050 [Noviherbaspirillum sp. CPCC 100848]|uniref:Uncharacterized protein n=1 Tax=Noviherbaspirillum album TaxID=3080276 RepID=A0ABU6JCB2_9BURK|nr:hypothetical protein [Noviherbaspirillum sp. CPCC 100848]MEC4721267.1 hypothetical protein [Noviherbaspirillum sp. CPCC 100848]
MSWHKIEGNCVQYDKFTALFRAFAGQEADKALDEASGDFDEPER